MYSQCEYSLCQVQHCRECCYHLCNRLSGSSASGCTNWEHHCSEGTTWSVTRHCPSWFDPSACLPKYVISTWQDISQLQQWLAQLLVQYLFQVSSLGHYSLRLKTLVDRDNNQLHWGTLQHWIVWHRWYHCWNSLQSWNTTVAVDSDTL